MYDIEVQTEFCAAHAIVIRGVREPVHGHNWCVAATLLGDTLDADGLLCDFHAVERALAEIVSPWHNENLNEIPPFDAMNPTAELVAKQIGERLRDALTTNLPAGVSVSSVSVTEAPGCRAVWRHKHSGE